MWYDYPDQVPSSENTKWWVIVAFLIFFSRFCVKPPLSNSTGVDFASITVSCVTTSTSRYTQILQFFTQIKRLPRRSSTIEARSFALIGYQVRIAVLFKNSFLGKVILFGFIRALRVWVSNILVVCSAYFYSSAPLFRAELQSRVQRSKTFRLSLTISLQWLQSSTLFILLRKRRNWSSEDLKHQNLFLVQFQID